MRFHGCVPRHSDDLFVSETLKADRAVLNELDLPRHQVIKIHQLLACLTVFMCDTGHVSFDALERIQVADVDLSISHAALLLG